MTRCIMRQIPFTKKEEQVMWMRKTWELTTFGRVVLEKSWENHRECLVSNWNKETQEWVEVKIII